MLPPAKELAWEGGVGDFGNYNLLERYNTRGLRNIMFKTLVILNRALNQGLQRPLSHFSLDIQFTPFSNSVRVWSSSLNRWVWAPDATLGIGSTIYECPDQAIEAHVLPLLCVSLNPECTRWAALSYLADPDGPNCHVRVDADVFHSVRNTFMGACREADGYMMFSLAGPQDTKITTIAFQQFYDAHGICTMVSFGCDVVFGLCLALLKDIAYISFVLRCK